jgi:hypothetical protein
VWWLKAITSCGAKDYIMTHKEREIYTTILQLCEEILPKTSMRNNQKIKSVLTLIREHLDA